MKVLIPADATIGRVVSVIFEYNNNIVICFNDNTFCVYNARMINDSILVENQFSFNYYYELSEELNIKYGFMTEEEYKETENKEKSVFAKNMRERELAELERLKAKYGNT